MPRAHRDGTVVAGVGDSQVSVDRRVPDLLIGAVCGGPGFLSPGVIGYQRALGGDAYELESLDLSTGQRADLRDKGANIVRFDGAGRWASWRPDEGVVDSEGRRYSLARLLDYDDGTLVLCPSHHTGQDIVLLRDGVFVQHIETGPLGADASQGPNVRLRGGVLAWQSEGRYHVIGAGRLYVPPPQPVYMVPVPLPDGRLAVLERDAHRLYLRWSDDLKNGIVLSTTADQHGADAVLTDDGDVLVTWSVGAKELPHEVVIARVAVSDIGRDDLTATPPVQVPALPRAGWLIPFHATRHTDSVVCPGHAEVITNGHDAGIRKVRRPVVADLATEPTADDVLAIWCDASRDAISAARSVADRRGVPLLAYHDHRTPFPSELGLEAGWDWIGVMLYSNPGETVEAFAAQCRAQLADASTLGQPIAMVVQMFDRNGAEKDVAKLARLQALWAELFVEYPAVIAICPFAVIRGPYGVTAYPFLQDALAKYAEAMHPPARPTRPVVPAPPAPPPPTPPVYDPLPFLQAIYRELLKREPDQFGLGYYGSRLIDGRMTEADVRADITRSPEYRALHAPPALAGLAGFRQAAEEAATGLKGDGDAAR